jgi:hypothetical protein
MTVSLDKRASPARWRYAFMYRGLRYTGSAPAGDNTQRAAKHEERAHLDRLRAGLSVKTSPTVAEFVVDFLAYQATECRPLTVENQTIHLEQHVVPRLGKVRLDAVTKLHLDELKVMWSRAGAAPRTINTRLDTLRRMLSIAEEWGRIGAIPVVKAVKVDADHPRFLTEPEAAALIRDPKMRASWLADTDLKSLQTEDRIGDKARAGIKSDNQTRIETSLLSNSRLVEDPNVAADVRQQATPYIVVTVQVQPGGRKAAVTTHDQG